MGIVALILLIALVLCFANCSGGGSSNPATVTVSTIFWTPVVTDTNGQPAVPDGYMVKCVRDDGLTAQYDAHLTLEAKLTDVISQTGNYECGVYPYDSLGRGVGKEVTVSVHDSNGAFTH